MVRFKISNGKTVVKGTDENGKVWLVEEKDGEYYKLFPSEYEEARWRSNKLIGFDDYIPYVAIFFVFISFLYLLNLINQGLTRLKEHKIYKVFRYILLFLSIASSIAFTIFSFIYIFDVML